MQNIQLNDRAIEVQSFFMDGTPVPEDHLELLSMVISRTAMSDPGELGELCEEDFLLSGQVKPGLQ